MVIFAGRRALTGDVPVGRPWPVSVADSKVYWEQACVRCGRVRRVREDRATTLCSDCVWYASWEAIDLVEDDYSDTEPIDPDRLRRAHKRRRQKGTA